ncbi:ImmA/IrrE family metallo-endopeptidase [Nakamurella sp. A5-74]|uniref:ImmA/IrrE family metallo-endopeptidase n=1 Tax=Nakamurella sp. A5-74 TaxID=3158264 RepID=A0AAU8DSF5_9ACTN
MPLSPQVRRPPTPTTAVVLARRVGLEFGVYDSNGRADVHDLVAKAGGRIVIDDTVESLVIHRSGTFKINVPSYTSARRDRFTIAHELGHYFLHYLNARPDEVRRKFTRLGRNPAETQANYFAAELVMPREQFREHFMQENGDLRRLARIFDVSQLSAQVRAESLGLIH